MPHAPLRLYVLFKTEELNFSRNVFNPILHGGGGGGWIPPLLTLVLNSASGTEAIVLMFGDFS